MSTPLLFQEIALREVKARNRIVVSPMCQYSAKDGQAGDWHLVHLGKFAQGGAGIVFVEATAVEKRGRITHGDTGLWEDAQVAGLRRISDFVKAQGAVPAIQLAHAGRKASMARPWHGNGPLTEEDFARHIEQTIDTDPAARWIFIVDGLNTHLSEALVRLVAERCQIKGDLGEKGRSGILRSMASRRQFLASLEHRIRFVYTPKHCSWLNQVEIWFSILVRRLLKRGSFASAQEVEERVLAFIAYFNRVLAKPMKWTYTGRPLAA